MIFGCAQIYWQDVHKITPFVDGGYPDHKNCLMEITPNCGDFTIKTSKIWAQHPQGPDEDNHELHFAYTVMIANGPKTIGNIVISASVVNIVSPSSLHVGKLRIILKNGDIFEGIEEIIVQRKQ